MKLYLGFYIQCNPDIRELLGPEKKYLISGFLLYPGLVYFIYINTGSNMGPEKTSLISELLLYPGYTVYNMKTRLSESLTSLSLQSFASRES